jgi:DNA processing protein
MVPHTAGYAPPPQDAIRVTTLEQLSNSAARPLKGADQFELFGQNGQSTQLFCAGDLTLASSRCVAIVGTREPGRMGAARARRLARELARAGVVAVSGLARGIDTEALTSAMRAGGHVIAVIGTPLDKAYPIENKRLQEQIYREHLLVSQFPRGQRVFQSNFPVRNRLMAAMTDATVIVEASDSSGTLHQATECVRLGRWLFLAESIVKSPRLTWPAKFLDKRRVCVLTSTEELLAALDR